MCPFLLFCKIQLNSDNWLIEQFATPILNHWEESLYEKD